MYWKFCQYAGLILEDPFEMIKKMTYTDKARETVDLVVLIKDTPAIVTQAYLTICCNCNGNN